jgi:hypothetical protein
MNKPDEEETFHWEDWMPEARAIAAQCWCDEETKHIEMDPVLAEAVARRIAFHARNEEVWRERAMHAEKELLSMQSLKKLEIAILILILILIFLIGYFLLLSK